ncbi:MAG: hypothetical protein ACRDD8_01020, partial [Bacteroidales bacterium]
MNKLNILDEINRVIEILEQGKTDGNTLKEIETAHFPYVGYLYDFMRHKLKKALSNGIITFEDYNNFSIAYDSCKCNSKLNKYAAIISELAEPVNTEKTDVVKAENPTKPSLFDERYVDSDLLLKLGKSVGINPIIPVIDEDFGDIESKQYAKPLSEIRIHENTDTTIKPKIIPVIKNVNPFKCDTSSLLESIDESSNSKITEYHCEYIYNGVKHEITVSLADMDAICRFYSADGGNMTQKQVGAKFNMTKLQIRELFKAYNITKSSAPFAPHVLLETATEELIERTMLIKEQMICERLNKDLVKNLEKRNFELLGVIKKLKGVDNLVDLSTISQYSPSVSNTPIDKVLYIYISDCHVGAYVSKRSIYKNKYDRTVFRDRLAKVVDTLVSVTANMEISKIVVCNLGDSLDGYSNKTTRGGHHLPQNMDNKEQFQS